MLSQPLLCPLWDCENCLVSHFLPAIWTRFLTKKNIILPRFLPVTPFILTSSSHTLYSHTIQSHPPAILGAWELLSQQLLLCYLTWFLLHFYIQLSQDFYLQSLSLPAISTAWKKLGCSPAWKNSDAAVPLIPDVAVSISGENVKGGGVGEERPHSHRLAHLSAWSWHSSCHSKKGCLCKPSIGMIFQSFFSHFWVIFWQKKTQFCPDFHLKFPVTFFM